MPFIRKSILKDGPKLILVLMIVILYCQENMAYRERFWHEEKFKVGKADKELVEELKSKILYPRSESCIRPQQETASNSRQARANTDSYEGRWSAFLGMYFFDFGYEIHNWEAVRAEPDPEVEPWTETASLFIFLFILILYLSLCTILIPIFGWLGFIIFRILWWICSQRSISLLARKFWIYNERRKRRRSKWLSVLDKTKNTSHVVRLPNWLRKYKEEEIPSELEEVEVESDDVISSDGFEGEDKKEEVDVTKQLHDPVPEAPETPISGETV